MLVRILEQNVYILHSGLLEYWRAVVSRLYYLLCVALPPFLLRVKLFRSNIIFNNVLIKNIEKVQRTVTNMPQLYNFQSELDPMFLQLH